MLKSKLASVNGWAFIGFFLLVFLTQFSARVVDYEQRVVDYQVILRLGYYAILVALFHRYILDFISYLLSVNKVFLVFLILMLGTAAINGVAYGVYAIMTNIVVIFAVYYYLQNYGNVVYRWYVYTVIAFCVVCLFYYFFIPDIGRYSYWQDGVFSQSSRMQGVAGHPNTLGFMILSALICFYSFYKKSVSGVLVFLFLFVCLILTNNRTSILMLFVFYYLMYGMTRGVLGYFLIALVLSGLAILLVNLVFPDLLIAVLGGVSRTGDVNEIFTFTGRSDIWDFALEMAVKKPIFGWGYGSVADILVINSEAVGFVVGQSHSLYLQILLAGGIVALVLFLFFAFGRLWFFIKNKYLTNFALLGSLLLVGLTEAIIFNTIANAALIVFGMAVFFVEKNE